MQAQLRHSTPVLHTHVGLWDVFFINTVETQYSRSVTSARERLIVLPSQYSLSSISLLNTDMDICQGCFSLVIRRSEWVFCGYIKNAVDRHSCVKSNRTLPIDPSLWDLSVCLIRSPRFSSHVQTGQCCLRGPLSLRCSGPTPKTNNQWDPTV